MFCPNCGSRNQDELVYCRECGENLQIVSQAMKGHLSVALVSKIDAVIEKKNERFRRDAILTALLGSVFLFNTIFGLINGIIGQIASNTFFLFILFSALVSVSAYLTSVWSYLGFRRSLELRAGHRGTSEVFENKMDPVVLPGAEASPIELETIVGESNSVYCPKCGLQNSRAASFCPSCGTGLELEQLPTRLERYLPRGLLRRLDASVAKNEAAPFKPQYRSWSAIMTVAVVFLINAGGNLVEGHWGNALTNFVLGLTLVVSGSWNLIAYRRTVSNDDALLDVSPMSRLDAIGPFLHTSWKTVLAILAACSGLVWYFGIVQSVPLVIVALLILLGSFLKFWQRQRDQYLLNRSSLPTGELASPDTFETTPLAHEPLSITEPTTKLLDPLMKEIEQEKAPTTQKLADRRR